MPLFLRMGKAYWTCFHLRLAGISAISHKSKELAGGYREERHNLIFGDWSQGSRVISCVRGSVILVCAVLRSRFRFPQTARPAFRPPSCPALRNDIPQSRFSGRL